MQTVERISEFADFKGLMQEWRLILDESSCRHPFLTWEWLSTWWRHLGEDRRLYLLAVRRDGQLTGIAPLAIRPARLIRLIPFPALEFLGTGSVGSDYLDFIVRRGEENDVMRALAGHLAHSRLVLELSHVEKSAPLAEAFASAMVDQGWVSLRRTTAYCPVINLSGHDWESYLASLGAAHRYNFRRRLRNLQRRFDVSFERAGTDQERRDALDVLIALHCKRWRQHGGSNALNSPALRAFHADWSGAALRRGWLRLYLLRLDGRPVAALYGFRHGATSYFYQAGFDPGFSQFSVGMVTLGLAIKSAIEEGASEYDLLHGEEAYKYLWARNRRELARIELYPPGAPASICRQAMILRRAAGSLLHRTPNGCGSATPLPGTGVVETIRSFWNRHAAWTD